MSDRVCMPSTIDGVAMKEYHKINSVFKRDERGKFLSEFSVPELELLKDVTWIWDEKIDGTNIRIHWDGEKVIYGGRTDNAQIPTTLIQELNKLFPVPKFQAVFPATPVTLYGEGYGVKIQKGGGNYIRDGVSFILFDVYIGGFWLLRKDVEDVSLKLGIDVVPVIGQGTLAEAIEFTRAGFQSKWGPFPAEGIVLRPAVPLFNRQGNRIITKLKLKDFQG